MRRSIKFAFGIVIILALCLAASGSASVWVDKLTLNKNGDFVTFRIYGTGPFQFTHATEDAKDGKPFRVFVDCQGAVFGLPDHSFYNLPSQTITAVRSAQYQAEPEKIVRVVLDCSRPVTYEVSSQENWVELTIVAVGEPDFQAWEVVGTDTWSHASTPGASEDNPNPNWTAPSSENSTENTTSENVTSDNTAPGSTASSSTASSSTAATSDGDSGAGVATTTDNQTDNQPDKTPTASAITLPEVAVSTDNPPSETSTDQPSDSESGNATDGNNEWTGNTNATDSGTEGSSDWTNTGNAGSAATSATGATGETSATETGTNSGDTNAGATSTADSEGTPTAVTSSTETIFSDKNTTGTNSNYNKFSGTNTGETGTTKGKTASSRLIETKPSLTSPKVSAPDAGSPTVKSETATASMIDKNIDPASLVKEPLVLPSTTSQANQLENYLQREKVKYSSKGRRDPFSPLVESDEAYEFGVVPLPNIENLKLVGVLEGFYENMALVEDSRGFAYILESGDRIKNGRVLRVDQDRLVCQLSEYGWTRNVSLDLYNQPK